MKPPPACRIAIMAKAPVAGLAKTRLAPALGAAGAAALAERLLERAAAQAAAAGGGGVTVWAAPDPSHPVFARLQRRHGVALAVQGEGDLGARMAQVFEQAAADRGLPLLLMGSDAPALDAPMLRLAAAALGDHDAVFVPALDGGYALVGLRAWGPRQRGLFTGMTWSTPRVMADTRRRLAAAGIDHVEMTAVADIDEPADLVHLPLDWPQAAALTMPDPSRSRPAMTDAPTAPEDAAPDPTPPLPSADRHESEAMPEAAAAPTAPDPGTTPETSPVTAQAPPPAAVEAPVGTPAEEPVDRAAAPPSDVAVGMAARQAPPTPVELSPAACAARLAELFPALFGAGRALPLKLRIQSDIQQRAPGIFTRKSLSPFLHRYTTSTAYLKALVNAPHRFDLDGAPAGDIDDVHRQAAAAELERRRGLFEAKRAAERAAANEARRRAETEARQQHAAEDAARRERAALLRAYESSTLTRANFCALKGIAEADLDGQLHQAWLEREQRAREQPPPPERGPQLRDERRATEPGRPDRPPGRNAPRRDAGPGGPLAADRGPRPDRGPPRPRGAAPPKPAR